MSGKARIKLVFWLCVLTYICTQAKVFAVEATAGHGGIITGFVKLKGPPPELPPLQIVKAKDFCEHVQNETLLIGPNQGIRYAVITLEGAPAKQMGETEAIHELDNIGCRFVPHVQAMQINQSLVLKNTDPILHTDHAIFQGTQPQFNVGLYPGKVTRKPMVSPGVVQIQCDVHPWMSAYIIVTENPYYAVSDAYGEYQIGDVPPGEYSLKVWHERLGTQEEKIVVKDNKTSKVDFAFTTAKEGNQ